MYLHVGPLKTGTTFIQELMGAHKEDLAAAGVCFPGRNWADQLNAVRDITGRTRDPAMRRASVGKWEELASTVQAHRGRATVISVETLAATDVDTARRAVESLTSAGTEVHAVVTVRDAAKLIPSQWQETCRNAGKATWPEFVRSIQSVAGPGPTPRGVAGRFRRSQDLVKILDTWGTVVPADRLHVLTVPRSKHDPLLLWRRFAHTLDLDPDLCPEPPKWSHPALGHPSAHLLALVNKRLPTMPLSEYRPTLKTYLAKQVLEARAGQEPRPQLDRAGHAFAALWNARTRYAIEVSNAHFVGTTDDLPIEVSDGDREQQPEDLSPPRHEDVLDAAVDAYHGLARLIGEHMDKLERVDVPAGEEPALPEATPPVRHWKAQQDPVDAAVADVADTAGTAIDLYRLLHGRK